MSLPAYPRRFRLPVGWALGLLGAVLGQGSNAQAQALSAPALKLRPSSALQEVIPDNVRQQSPTFIQSDRLSGQTDVKTVLEGNVMMRRGNILLKADKVDYDPVADLAQARGNVTINRSGNVYQGPALDIHLDAFEGFFTQPGYQLLKNNAYGKAQRIEFVDNAHTVMHQADFTTCKRKPGPDWLPDWFFKADTITLDADRNVGLAEGAALIFKGVPILPIPNVDFPLTEERKSGFLPPTIGVDNIGGLEYTQPYYLNLAPNRDMTFFPTYWSRRGLRLGTEFRYLENLSPDKPFGGEARLDYMEKDLLRGERRWGLQYKHTGLIEPSYAGGRLGLNLSFNRVSDDNYWKDFSLVNSSGVQRLLSNDAALNWTDGVFSTSLRAQKWQTLQDLADTSNRITPPFDRVPQLIARMQRSNVAGFDFSIQGDLTRFESARDYECANNGLYNCAPNANRSVASLQLSRPFTNSFGYLTPKVQLHGRSYQFDGGLPSNSFYNGHQGQTSASVTVPTFSLDSGVTFERTHRLFDRAWLQTLEPRAFYVYTPYRDQNYLPNYDSGGNAFNFASVFTENAFGGNDRISDSKLLTLGAISRLLDPQTGAEGARFGLAQRLRMQDQRVLIPGDTTARAGISDVLAGASLNLNRSWALDSTVQYNPKTENYSRRMLGGRYSPGSYRVINAAYRSQNNDDGSAASRQFDIGWQWPLHDLWGGQDESLGEGRGLGEGRWYSVARMNYSPLDHKVVESVIGFEYDAGCWLSRVVAERLQVTDGLSRQRLLFQLEFVGFSRVGTNALGSLRSNVPRYQPLRQNSMTPSRFGNYD